MSSQSMKYHELPSFETLVAYQKGDLSAVEKQWIDQLMKDNPMVRAVVESSTQIKSSAVQSISKRTAQRLSDTYFSELGFWTKYRVWIGLSALAILLGAVFLFKTEKPEALYSKKALSMNNHVQENEQNNFQPSDYDLVGTETEGLSDAEIEEKEIQDLEHEENIEGNKELEVDEIDKLKKNNKDLTWEEEILIDQNIYKTAGEDEESQNSEDNTRSFSTQSAKANKTITLSVQQVQILAKSNPDDINSSSKKDKKGNPLQVFGQDVGSGASYSIDDVPKYPGGDRALQNYFTGKLRPIVIVESENRFDRSVMIDLEVNSRGRLKDYQIYGELHPDHQKALIKAIEDLPRFSKGAVSIIYSLGIAF